MPVATEQKVRALADDLRSQRRLAELLGVNPAQVSRWLRGQGIDEVNAARIEVLELVMSQLLRLYPSDLALRWLEGVNPHLGDRRPVDLIRCGRAAEVLDAIAAERTAALV